MRTALKLIAGGAAASLLLGLVMMGAPAEAGITNSAHDFTQGTWDTGESEICIPCHTPHNAPVDIPLWNHEVTTASFTSYSSATMNGTAAVGAGSVSQLCLSCHDGSVAISDYGGTTNGTDNLTGTALLSTDLSNDHPIGVDYSDSTVAAGDMKTQPSSLPFFGAGNDVECATCHDVHNNGSSTKLLRIDNAASALCFTCHDK